MAITNSESDLFIYCNLNNEVIIKCIDLTKIYQLNKYNDKIFMYNKVKIITIYDIYKNIISIPIRIDLFKDPIINGDILENLKEKNIYFFKTFLESFLIKNKLNGIKYDTDNNNIFTYNFSYNNIHIEIYNSYKRSIIYNKDNITYNFYFLKDVYHIHCIENGTITIYTIDNNCIKINIIKKMYNQVISINKKNLKIFKIKQKFNFNTDYKEKRNNNNEITHLTKIIYDEIKEKFISNNKNPPFSKPLKKYHIRLNNYFIEEIINFIKIIEPIFKKINEVHYNLLLNYNLEMIDF